MFALKLNLQQILYQSHLAELKHPRLRRFAFGVSQKFPGNHQGNPPEFRQSF
jgi:hypothetical protein